MNTVFSKTAILEDEIRMKLIKIEIFFFLKNNNIKTVGEEKKMTYKEYPFYLLQFFLLLFAGEFGICYDFLQQSC